MCGPGCSADLPGAFNMQVSSHLRPAQHVSSIQQQVLHRHRLPPVAFKEGEDANGEVTENRVIVVTSGKGGVGKTTASANLGMSIARCEVSTDANNAASTRMACTQCVMLLAAPQSPQAQQLCSWHSAFSCALP